MNGANLHDDSPRFAHREGFWSILWHVFSSFAVGLLLVYMLVQESTRGAGFIGLSILVAGHTIARAIRGYK